jgi:hypothetical protein
MYDTFLEIINIIKAYSGGRYLFFLYLAALAYLLATEKEKRLRALLVYAPLTILLVFLTPPFRWFYIAADLDGETYYRVLWLLPMGVTIAYAGCALFARHRRIGLAVLVAVIVLAGTYVYGSPHITKAENRYKIPTATINVCDYILADAEFDYIHAAFPKEHVQYVRQYDSRIRLAFGRDALVERWGVYNEVYEAMEKSDPIDVPALLEAARALHVNYLVIHFSRALSDNPENLGLTLLDQVDGLVIYRDEEVADFVRWAQNEYYNENGAEPHLIIDDKRISPP